MGHLRLGGWGKAPQDFTKFSMFELLAINQKFDEKFLSKSLKAFYNKQAIQNCTNKKIMQLRVHLEKLVIVLE